MATHNSEKFISECISSILGQTFENFELIVVVDAPTDSTRDLVEAFKDARVKVIINKENLGLTKSLNIALRAAKGNYIARIDSDDVAKPERLEAQINYMIKNPKTDVLGTSIEKIDSRGKSLGVFKYPLTHSEIVNSILRFNPFAHPTVMFRNSGSLFYDESFLRSQDYELWLRTVKTLKFENLDNALTMYRVHDKSITVSDLSNQSFFAKEARSKFLINSIPGINDLESLDRLTCQNAFTLEKVIVILRLLFSPYAGNFNLKKQILKEIL